MEREEIKQYVKKWMDGHEPDTFIKNKHGNYIYSAGAVSLDLPSYFEMLLEDFTESLSPTVTEWVNGRKVCEHGGFPFSKNHMCKHYDQCITGVRSSEVDECCIDWKTRRNAEYTNLVSKMPLDENPKI